MYISQRNFTLYLQKIVICSHMRKTCEKCILFDLNEVAKLREEHNCPDIPCSKSTARQTYNSPCFSYHIYHVINL